MYLLIDECCSKGLVKVAQSLGHTAQRTISVRALGRAASDADIHQFASRNGAILVTENSADFRELAGQGKAHPGIILMPNIVGKEAAMLFKKLLPEAERVFTGKQNMFVEIDEGGLIKSFQLP